MRNGATGGAAAVVLKQRTFLGHPVGLYILFFTEMWERFSYYGMRGLLVLYMVNYFKWMQKDASLVYKWYSSLVYLTPLLGGYLADRFLGNKRAVIIGAVLMAIGHFLMAFEAIQVFTAALIFLIIGNGFFKPNMSTQVGRLYTQNDARRDGAYTIFYMGINLGAFLSPLVCGWLADNTVGGYHTGFTMAGVGMVFGLLIYVIGMRWVVELDQDTPKKPNDPEPVAGAAGRPDSVALSEEEVQERKTPQLNDAAMPEAQAETAPSSLPWLNWVSPGLLGAVGCLIALGTLAWAGVLLFPWLLLVAGGRPHPTFAEVIAGNDNLISLGIVAACTLIASWILFRVRNAERDRVLAIYALGVFVVFFWAAFEQGGNAMNLWADKTTNRYLTASAPDPSIYPEASGGPAKGGEAAAPARAGGLMGWITMWQLKPTQAKPNQSWWDWWVGVWNPVPTTWFQSINALAIFVLAPVFAVLWVWLERRRINPSTPVKMALGVVLMSSAFGLMIFSARWENGPTDVALPAGLPPKGQINDKHQLLSADAGRPYQEGRLTYDAATQTLHLHGVLSDTERDLIIRESAPDDYAAALKELQKKADELPDNFGKVTGSASVHLDRVPPGFDLKYAGLDKREVSFDEAARTLTVTNKRLADKDVKGLLVAGGDEKFRKAVDELYQQSARYKVSSWWLFWFYILSTLGELCLSPVGLSMVSKLAPAKFATMLMGLWLLTSFFGNFAAGQFGEAYDSTAPTDYFTIIMIALAAAAVVLFVLVRAIKGLMHGVK